MASKFTVYSFAGSQWAGVAHLILAEKGFIEGTDYETKEIDLIAAENFDPSYVAINPNGTVPSLVSPALAEPLIHSTDILHYLDQIRGDTLVPSNPITKSAVQDIVDLVHSEEVDTNVILLQARDSAEMDFKRSSMWKTFLENRQAKLDKEAVRTPSHPLYARRAKENDAVYKLYITDEGPDHEAFFSKTHEQYRTFAKGLEKLESLIVLPYAAGEKVSEADFHTVPWLSHALWGAGTNATEIQNFDVLQALIQKSSPNFEIGPRIREWWANIAKLPSFKTVFPVLH